MEVATAEKRPILTVIELAEMLSVPVSTVYRWNYAGTGPRAIKVGKYVRYRRVDVETWLEAHAES
jgi:excisionase family DNA binding protein